MKYIIEQYPKNKIFDLTKLSIHQIFLRQNTKLRIYKEEKICNTCLIKQPINEFYIKDRETGRRSNMCRDCQLKQAGIIEVGKLRFAAAILKKGFRRCSVCKDIKPITAYTKSISGYGGYSNNCYECSNKLHSKFLIKQKKEIGDFYVRQYGIRNGITEFTNEIIEQLRNKIIESRKPKYFLNGKSFLTATDFAIYIELNYNIAIPTTTKRLYEGAKESECIMQENEYRKLKSGTNKGRIKVTDVINGKIFIFNNTRDEGLLKMFSCDTVNKGIKSKKSIGGKRSKYKNPCIIERIARNNN
jgi:hypothetical protein